MLDLSTYVNLSNVNTRTITVKDISIQTDNEDNNIMSNRIFSNVSTQTIHNEDAQELKSANDCFGMFVARELSNVSQLKRRQIMWEIVRLFEYGSF